MKSCFKGKFRVTSPRGMRTLWGKNEFHKGIDLVGIDDTTVYSISGGTVKTAFQKNGAGNYVVVTMDDGRRIFYMHLASFKVKTGDKVITGQPIGVMGATGAVTGAHTHLELRPKGTTGDSLDICEFTGIKNKIGVYSYSPTPTFEEIVEKVKTGYHFENQTIEFLKKYKYAHALFERLAEKL